MPPSFDGRPPMLESFRIILPNYFGVYSVLRVFNTGACETASWSEHCRCYSVSFCIPVAGRRNVVSLFLRASEEALVDTQEEWLR